MLPAKRIICSAPSGAGKTTLLRAVMEQVPALQFSVSATTRAPRPNEEEGRHYYFLTMEAFEAEIAQQAFVEYEEVYPGTFYGTLKRELSRIDAAGGVPLFEVDVKGGLALKRLFGANALAVFLAPPNIETLKQRLVSRGTETPEQIARRVMKAEWELAYQDRFDRIVVNEDLDRAVAEFVLLVEDFLKT